MTQIDANRKTDDILAHDDDVNDGVDPAEALDILAPLPPTGISPYSFDAIQRNEDQAIVVSICALNISCAILSIDRVFLLSFLLCSQEDFLTVAENLCVANEVRVDPVESPSHSTSSVSSSASQLSVSSMNSFLPSGGGYGGQLSHLTRLIDKYTALQYAKIVATECYTQNMFFGSLS